MSSIPKLNKIITKDGFTSFRPTDELMGELKKLPDGDRCGIYIHVVYEGNDEYFYVGQALDMRKRYMQHKKKYDIVLSAVCFVSKSQLGFVEEKYITLLNRLGLNLRNILISDENSLAGDLFDVFGEKEQLEWLADEKFFYEGKFKSYKQESAIKFKHRYDELIASPDYESEYMDFISTFIRYCVPHPEKTEKEFWTLNCLTNAFGKHPARALFRVSVHRPEVLTFVVNHKDPAMEPFMVMFTIYPEAMTEEEHQEIKGIAGYVAYEANGNGEPFYKTAGFKHWQVRAYSIETAWELLRHAGFRRAIKESVLRLMRKGHVPRNFSQSHCLPLCEEVMRRPAKL